MWEDLARVCAAQAGLKSGSDGETSKCCSRDQLQSPRLWAKADQAESYEQLVKRRQQEVRHLQALGFKQPSIPRIHPATDLHVERKNKKSPRWLTWKGGGGNAD